MNTEVNWFITSFFFFFFFRFSPFPPLALLIPGLGSSIHFYLSFRDSVVSHILEFVCFLILRLFHNLFTDTKRAFLIDARQLNYQPVGSSVLVLPLGTGPNLVQRPRGRAWMEGKELESGRELGRSKADYTLVVQCLIIVFTRSTKTHPGTLESVEGAWRCWGPARQELKTWRIKWTQKYLYIIIIISMILLRPTDSYQDLWHLVSNAVSLIIRYYETEDFNAFKLDT